MPTSDKSYVTLLFSIYLSMLCSSQELQFPSAETSITKPPNSLKSKYAEYVPSDTMPARVAYDDGRGNEADADG